MGWVRWLRLSGVLTLIVTLYFVIPASGTPSAETLPRLLAALLVFVGLAVLMVRQLRLQLNDTTRKVDGLIIGILMVVVVFAYAFYMLNRRDPGQVAGLGTRVDSLYFVMNNLTTIGTGDVHATGQTARVLVLVQMVFNVVFVATTATFLTTRIRTVVQARVAERRTQEPPPG
jgi:voltage-gated potassium channel